MASDSQHTFLLVDSQLDRIDEACRLLQEMGYFNFLEAEDGQEAFSMISGFDVDFVLCAMDVGEIGGLALLRILRSDERYADTPFVLLGENLTTSLVAQAGRAGVDDIIVLPFTPDTFKAKIKSIVEAEPDPRDIEAERLYEDGLEMMKAGRYEEALHSFEDILSVNENAEVYFNMGYIKSSKGLWDEAIALFRRATQINNGYARAYKMMAEAYDKLGEPDMAEESMHRAAEIFIERKQDEEAEEALEGVLRYKPDTINVYNSLGIVYRRQGRFAESAGMYEKALKVHPKDEHIHYNLARVYVELKDFERARGNLEQALAINPRFSPARELARVAELSLSLEG